MIDIEHYLQRINYTGPREPTATVLRDLQVAHLRHVPFENLDLYARRPLTLDERGLFAKVVERRRGGFCYELNGTFAQLLRALGFDVTLLAAGVANDSGSFGPDFDHLLLLVQLEQRWLADVGFGSSFEEPLLLDEPGEQAQRSGVYRIEAGSDYWTYLVRDDAGEWQPGYRFTTQPRTLDDFRAECQLKEQSPFWTDRRICTRATPEGRITLSNMRLIVTQGEHREEREVANAEEYTALLRDEFGIVLP